MATSVNPLILLHYYPVDTDCGTLQSGFYASVAVVLALCSQTSDNGQINKQGRQHGERAHHRGHG